MSNTPTDPVPLAQALIRCPSVTPADAGALAVLEAALAPLGFACHRMRFGETENLFARRGTEAPHFCYAGHTDVVPPGEQGWTDGPFSGVVRDGTLYGRGACDMKGGIAAFVAGLTDFLAANPNHAGSIRLLITGDEAGPAKDGTTRVLDWMAGAGHIPDMALVWRSLKRMFSIARASAGMTLFEGLPVSKPVTWRVVASKNSLPPSIGAAVRRWRTRTRRWIGLSARCG